MLFTTFTFVKNLILSCIFPYLLNILGISLVFEFHISILEYVRFKYIREYTLDSFVMVTVVLSYSIIGIH